MRETRKIKTYPLNGSPKHWHYIIHSGEGGRTRERISAETFATLKAAFDAAEKVRRRNEGVAGLQCSHMEVSR